MTLRIDTFVDRSKIPNAGNGVFTKRATEVGTLIWEFRAGIDQVFPASILADTNLTPQERACLKNYGYMYEPGKLILCGDDARFTNHAETPTMLPGPVDPQNPEGTSIAARDLPPGTELTEDYGFIDPHRQHPFPIGEVKSYTSPIMRTPPPVPQPTLQDDDTTRSPMTTQIVDSMEHQKVGPIPKWLSSFKALSSKARAWMMKGHQYSMRDKK